jgi:hypothetical protein
MAPCNPQRSALRCQSASQRDADDRHRVGSERLKIKGPGVKRCPAKHSPWPPLGGARFFALVSAALRGGSTKPARAPSRAALPARVRCPPASEGCRDDNLTRCYTPQRLCRGSMTRKRPVLRLRGRPLQRHRFRAKIRLINRRVTPSPGGLRAGVPRTEQELRELRDEGSKRFVGEAKHERDRVEGHDIGDHRLSGA